MKKFILALLILAVVGCESVVDHDEGKMVEQCYDGVVYVSKITGQANLSVKFNPDSTVATKTFDGRECPK